MYLSLEQASHMCIYIVYRYTSTQDIQAHAYLYTPYFHIIRDIFSVCVCVLPDIRCRVSCGDLHSESRRSTDPFSSAKLYIDINVLLCNHLKYIDDMLYIYI